MAVTHPTLAKFFHPTKNGEWTTANLKAGTGEMLWWQCSKNSSHTWQSTKDNLKKTPRPDLCPTCRKTK